MPDYGTYSSTLIASIPPFPPYTPSMNRNRKEFRPPTTMYAPPRIRSQLFIGILILGQRCNLSLLIQKMAVNSVSLPPCHILRSCYVVFLRTILSPAYSVPRQPPLASFDGTALDEALVYVDGDCDPVPGVPAVVQVIAVFGVNDIHVIVVVPIVRPVLWPWVHETEPKAAVLEARVPSIQLHRVPVDAEPVIRTKVATITVIWNTVAVVAAALLPVTVLGLPVTCAMLLPHLPLLTWLHPLPLP